MEMSNNEIMKLFDFILENENIIIGDKELFNRYTLKTIRAIVKGKIPNNFQLTPEQERLIVEAFLTSNNIFDEETPDFILKNNDCINAAIERNIYSANFVENLTPELSEKVLNLAINSQHILTSDSPVLLKRNYDIALSSIRQDSNSANHVDWDYMTKKDFDSLMQEAAKAGYELSSESCYALINNPNIVLNSIKKNMDTLIYSSNKAKNDLSVFKYLIEKGHYFSRGDLRIKPLSSFADKDVMKYAIQKIGIFDKEDFDFIDCFEDYPDDIDKYIERSVELYIKAIQTSPTIKGFKSILQVCAEEKWNEYREENIDNYANVFGKICTQLKNFRTC